MYDSGSGKRFSRYQKGFRLACQIPWFGQESSGLASFLLTENLLISGADCNEFWRMMEWIECFVTAAAFYFILLFVITKANWRNSVTAILGIYDVNNTTPFFSRIHLIQNDVLYRERKEERGKKKERALMKLGWRIKRYIWHRDNRNVFISRTLGRYNVTDEWHDARKILPK
jgi:hypothetical protein